MCLYDNRFKQRYYIFELEFTDCFFKFEFRQKCKNSQFLHNFHQKSPMILMIEKVFMDFWFVASYQIWKNVIQFEHVLKEIERKRVHLHIAYLWARFYLSILHNFPSIFISIYTICTIHNVSLALSICTSNKAPSRNGQIFERHFNYSKVFDCWQIRQADRWADRHFTQWQ